MRYEIIKELLNRSLNDVNITTCCYGQHIHIIMSNSGVNYVDVQHGCDLYIGDKEVLSYQQQQLDHDV